MQTLIELAPLAAFFGVWAATDIYIATAVLMGAMVLLLAWDWLSTRKIPSMHLLSAILVWIFGAATLILHDVRFIQWKATVFYWLVALAVAGSLWIGKMTLLERFLGAALPEGTSVPSGRWRVSSMIYAAFYLVLGAVNLWVAYNLSETAWVVFKSWIAVPLIFAFTAGLMFWLLSGQAAKEST
jgi:intracellular septation protein